MDKNLRPYMAELLGTFAVVFVSTATVCVEWAGHKAGQPAPVGIALAYGLIYAAGLAATVPISGMVTVKSDSTSSRKASNSSSARSTSSIRRTAGAGPG